MHTKKQMWQQTPTNSIELVYKSALLLGLAVPTAIAGTSTNLVGPVYQGTSDGNTAADYAADIYSANNPAATISFSGQTALRAFDTTQGITELTPGTTIVLHDGTNGAPVTYPANSSSSTYFQLASSDFTSQDFYPGSPANDLGATLAQNSAIRLEWHEQGSVDGEYDLINDEVGFVPTTSGGTGPISNEALRVPSTSNPTWINTNKFTAGATINGFVLDASTSDNLANTYDPTVYNQPTGVNIQGGQNRIQFSVGEYKTEGLSVAGNASPFASSGAAGYGLGNPAIAAATTFTGLGVGNTRQSFQPTSIVSESTNKVDPQTGQNYPAGPWNTAGSDNISSTQVAVTAVGFSANPGTGLAHLNLADTQWLQTTGRLQNGAVFNFVARTVDTGQRIVAAQNTGIDPSWAVGTNDDGNSTSTTSANAQHSVGPSLRFDGKTSGTEAQKTISAGRMAVGVLSLPETRATATNTPVRNLNVDFSAADGYSTNPSNFIAINYDTIVSDGVNPISIPGDPNNGTVVPHYPAILISQYNSIKTPNPTALLAELKTQGVLPPSATSFTQATAAQQSTAWAALNTFDPTTAETDGTPSVPVTGIKGDTTGDVAAFISNITNSNGTAAKGLTATTVNDPADNLFINGFLVPGLLNYTRVSDGGAITPVTVSAGTQNEQSAVESNYSSLFTPNGTGGANNQTIGSGSTYGATNTGGSAINGPIAITAKDATGNAVSNGTLAPAGNYLFGNFNQNGVRDLSALQQAVNAVLSLYAVDGASGGKNSIFTPDGGVTNGTTIPSLIGTPGWVSTGTNTKGDLIVLGDYNGDGKFNGQDLYQLAEGASLTSSNSATGLSATYNTFADALRDPTDVLRKNAALSYVNTYLNNPTANNATAAQALWVRQTAAAVLTTPNVTTAAGIPRNATALNITDPVTGLEQFTYDVNGANAFNPADVNRDGVVDFNDAVLADQYNGNSYSNLAQSLAATQQTPVNGMVEGVSLVNVQQVDGEAAIGSADVTAINSALTGSGNTNWYGYALNKSGPGTLVWARTGGTVTVYSGASLQISAGTVQVNSAIDPFTDSSATGTDTSQSLSIAVNGGKLEYTPASTSGIQIEKAANLNIASGSVVIDPVVNHANRALLITAGLTLGASGKLDLGNSDLDVQAGNLATIRAQLATGFNGGTWNNSTGITSMSAANDSNHLLALGVIQNNQSGTAIYSASSLFDGIAPGASDILVKSTYFGDANLDGKVDGSDYTRIDSGFLSGGVASGWYNGDFNYDGVINGSDYTLIDNAFNRQGASLATGVATADAIPTAIVAGNAAVPEPSVLAFGTGASLMLGRRRRRTNKK